MKFVTLRCGPKKRPPPRAQQEPSVFACQVFFFLVRRRLFLFLMCSVLTVYLFALAPVVGTQDKELLLAKCLAAIARKTHVTVS